MTREKTLHNTFLAGKLPYSYGRSWQQVSSPAHKHQGINLEGFLFAGAEVCGFLVRMSSPDSSLNQPSYPPAMGGKTAILSPSFGIVSRSA